jgi:hypothetical protein
VLERAELRGSGVGDGPSSCQPAAVVAATGICVGARSLE